MSPDLLFTSRIVAELEARGLDWIRIDRIDRLPSAETVALLLVDWAARGDGWDRAIRRWSSSAAPGPRVVLYGPHSDLASHRAARLAKLGPMLARSSLVSRLQSLLVKPSDR